jgi:hypothetical protein
MNTVRAALARVMPPATETDKYGMSLLEKEVAA